MAKKTTRKKLSRRQRQERGISQPRQKPTPAEPKVGNDPNPAPLQPQTPEAPEPAPVAAEAATPGITFQPTTQRGPGGISQDVVASEFPAVSRDLKRLGVSIIVLATIVAGLSILANQTNVIGDLGARLFDLWQ